MWLFFLPFVNISAAFKNDCSVTCTFIYFDISMQLKRVLPFDQFIFLFISDLTFAYCIFCKGGFVWGVEIEMYSILKILSCAFTKI